MMNQYPPNNQPNPNWPNQPQPNPYNPNQSNPNWQNPQLVLQAEEAERQLLVRELKIVLQRYLEPYFG